MNTTSKFVCSILVLGCMLAGQYARGGDIVYNNTNTFTGPFAQTTGYEMGDEITLSGTSRYITDFNFVFWATNFSGDEQMRLRFYRNDGAATDTVPVGHKPSTMIFDSGFFDLSDLGVLNSPLHLAYFLNYSEVNVPVPDTFTWTVEFSGVGAGENAGLNMYNPPTVGSSYDDRWEHSPDGAWGLYTNLDSSVANFGATAVAISVVDGTPPSLLTWLPADKSETNGVLRLSGTAQDAVGGGLAAIPIILNDTGAGLASLTFTNVNSLFARWTNYLTLATGTNTVAIKVIDKAGNTVTSANRNYFLKVTNTVALKTNVFPGAGKYTTGTGANAVTDGAKLLIGRSYTVTATALANYTFDHWDIESPTDGGTNTSASAALTFMMRTNLTLRGNFYSNAPTISKQPVSRTNHQGSLASFSVTGVGAGLTYHWRKNGVDIPGATQSGYTNPAVSLSDGGDSPGYSNNLYTVAITNNGGYIISDAVRLTVRPDTNNPAVAFTAPADKQEFTSPEILVKGTAGDTAGQHVTNVFLSSISGVTNPVTFYLNSTYTSATWSNVVTLAPGTNTLAIRSVDFAGNWSPVVVRRCFYRTASTFTLVTNGLGSIISTTNKIPPFTDQPTNNGSLFEGRGYTVTAVDGTNWIFTNWLASVDGGPDTVLTTTNFGRTLKFNMQPNLRLTAVFVTNVYNAGVGTYNGLFSDSINGPRVESAGFILFKFLEKDARTKPKPTFAGTLYVNGFAPTFSGTFDDLEGNGVAKPIALALGLTPTVMLRLHMGLAGEDQIIGTVSNMTVGGWVSDLVADRSYFATNNLATGQQGIYTMIISNNPATAATTNSPGGDGYLTVHVETNGLITAQGYLADGFALKPVAPPSPQPGIKVPVSKNGDWPLFAQLYKDKYEYGPGPTVKTRYDGILMGWVHVDNATSAGLDTASSDGLYWIKEAPVTNALNFYAGGFTNPPVQVVASTYTPPVGSVRQIPLNSGSGALTVWGDGYLVGTLTDYVNLAANNNWTVTGLGGDLTGMQKIAAPVVSTKPDVGSVLGYQTNAVNPNAKFPNIRGVVLQNQGIVRGAYGMATNQSGFMRIDPY